jgi:hypothetical protein
MTVGPEALHKSELPSEQIVTLHVIQDCSADRKSAKRSKRGRCRRRNEIAKKLDISRLIRIEGKLGSTTSLRKSR